MRRACVFAGLLALLLLAGMPPALGLERTIAATTSESATVGDQGWDAYHVNVPFGQKVTVHFSAAGAVDFYVMSDADYAEYTNPASTSFHSKEGQENAYDFSYATSSSYVFVIDNARISTTGASGGAPVSYTVGITFASASLLEYSCYIVPALVVLGIFGTSYWLYSPPKKYRDVSRRLRAVLR